MPLSETEIQEINKKEFITKVEAMSLLGLSTRTLEKFISKKIKNLNPNDQKYYKKVPIEGRTSGFKYLLNRAMLVEHFMNTGSGNLKERIRKLDPNYTEKTKPEGSAIGLLQQTISMLQRELEEKNSQIRNLQESHKLAQILIAQAQGVNVNKLLKAGEVQEIQNNNEEVKKKQSSGLLHWLFGR